MDVHEQMDRLGRRFDSEESIFDALQTLHREGVAICELENCLVRIGPTDLDLLSDVLARLRQTMAANDEPAPVSQPAIGSVTASPSTRSGRFAPSR